MAMTAPALAVPVTWQITGSITEASDTNGIFAVSANPGDSFNLLITLEDEAIDQRPDSDFAGMYIGNLLSSTLSANGLVFEIPTSPLASQSFLIGNAPGLDRFNYFNDVPDAFGPEVSLALSVQLADYVGNSIFSDVLAFPIVTPAFTDNYFSFRAVRDFTDLARWVGRVDNISVYVPPEPLAVPEPGMLSLFGIGLLGLGLAQRKR